MMEIEMPEFVSRYESIQPDENGYVTYSDEDNHTWSVLYERQMKILQGRACDEFMQGLNILKLRRDSVPQIPDVNTSLSLATGWRVQPVTALISHKKFFELLASQYFPAATFVRTPDELDYLQEPDIFHECFGHGPMLTQAVFADFVQQFAKMTLQFPEDEWPLLQRLFWFTVEFGLIHTPDGLRAYGGGILSSIKETVYCISDKTPERREFNLVDIFRTPYRIDDLQKIYYVINDFKQIFDLVNNQDALKQALIHARELGEFEPNFTVENNNPSQHVNFC